MIFLLFKNYLLLPNEILDTKQKAQYHMIFSYITYTLLRLVGGALFKNNMN